MSKSREPRPLNKLTPMEYADDFKLYLQNCLDPDQRNLKTYFSELEHQEGSIREDVKYKVASLVARRVMAQFYVEIDNIRSEVQEWVIEMLLKDEDNVWYSYEDSMNWVAGVVGALKRGWDKR